MASTDDPSSIDYRAVEIDSAKSTSDYSSTERRADLYARLQEAGHPRLLPSQRELGEQYGISQPVISEDLGYIAEYVAATLGDRHVMTADAVYDRCVRELMDAGEWRAAARTVSGSTLGHVFAGVVAHPQCT